jgi:hypothetical protein
MSINGDWTTRRLQADLAQREAAVKQQEIETQMRVVEMQQALRTMQETPFEETEDFRDFIVWLCGFTDHHAPPDQEDWDELKNKAKQVAAKFALQARDRMKKAARKKTQGDLFGPNTPPYYSGKTGAATGTVTVATGGNTAPPETITLDAAQFRDAFTIK